jgi:hypothetical protein
VRRTGAENPHARRPPRRAAFLAQQQKQHVGPSLYDRQGFQSGMSDLEVEAMTGLARPQDRHKMLLHARA